ncbi:DEAD/DEAH box helicase [Longivirga aurantiaca]|uniref:DEAD/DEAH box helicase n=1 Tax=Longivirga aurantiaca TaxID=1837743 RepID=A0ABW1T031_9ACTN
MPENAVTREELRSLLARAQMLAAQAESITSTSAGSSREVADGYRAVVARMVARELGSIPVARLRDVTEGRLRLGPIESRYKTVAQLQNVSAYTLMQLPGVGEATASQVVAAVHTVARTVEDGFRLRIDLDASDPVTTDLLRSTWRYDSVTRAVAPVREPAGRMSNELERLAVEAKPAGYGALRSLFTSRAKKDGARAAVERIEQWMRWSDSPANAAAWTGAIAAIQAPTPSAADAWRAFETRSPEFYGALGEVVDLRLDVGSAQGFLPAEIVAKVEEQLLDTSMLKVSLRGYQSFGARFALVQRKVIIGDEMGLGKTIQALAVMTHLASSGKAHFLVVCPASVLVNWIREIRTRSDLQAYQLHGPDTARQQGLWTQRGGVAVTTFEGLRRLSLREVPLLVVDEAHFVKNPTAQRSQLVASWIAGAERTLFLTGTPMENRVEEFQNLVRYLQPQVANRVNPSHGLAGADAFRRAVAPVYLRRNQDDVLMELPDLMSVEEWESFGPSEAASYRDAVMGGNFMAMRRAAFDAVPVTAATKMARLLELCDEAAANGHKVLVFSFFRDVLDKVAESLGSRAHGPLTGSVPAAKRQAVVDGFTAASSDAVLVAQIQAGGVGLNVQAANIVILCEPQVKPSAEAQAIARAHRMGQVRKVQVHRLLVENSVDQRMLEILGAKQALFDEYAAKSDLASATPDAVDISETELAKTIVAAEQERLARELMEQQALQ